MSVPETGVLAVHDARALHAALPDDAYLRCELQAGQAVDGYVTADGSACALIRPRWTDDRANVLALGSPGAALGLTEHVLSTRTALAAVMVPTGAGDLAVPGVDLRQAWSWRWMWVASPPAVQPGEDAVEQVDDDAVTVLLEQAYPHPSRLPGHPLAAGWLGIRAGTTSPGGGAQGLVACGTWEWHTTHHAHLSTIAVHPDARGRGLGAALSAALVRRLLDGALPHPQEGTAATTVGLGVYPDNTTAIRLYERLGFRATHAFDTWLVEG